ISGLGIDGKKLIHLRHDANRDLIFGIEFDCIEELSPGMRPPRGVHDTLSTDMIVGSIAVTLEDPLEVTQEPFGTFSFPAHPKIENDWANRSAVFPEGSLVIFAPTLVHLHCHG